MESSAPLFLAHVPEDRRERFAALPDLDATLARLVATARGVWSEIPLPDGAYLAFLGRCAPEDAAHLEALRADDLYLVCAYALGAPGAYDALERSAMGRVRAALGRLGAPPAMIADIVQELRRRLVETQRPRPDRKLYAGRGDLVGWLCVSAVREANLRRERRARELPIELAGDLLSTGEDDAEMALLLKSYKPELTRAFQEAVASLSAQDRNLLRYHFLDGLSIDRVGLLYGVHRATAARWINRAREALCARTLELFQGRVSLSAEGFNRVLGLIQSQLHVELAAAPA